jgi:hypothetical protein
MKSMLEGLDLSLPNSPYSRASGKSTIIQMGVVIAHTNNLRTALVAALAVIDAENDYDEFAKSRGGIRASKRLLDANRELETALEPFRVVEDDAKDGV